VRVRVGVTVRVRVGVNIGVRVGVLVGVRFGVIVGVRVAGGLALGVEVTFFVAVSVEVGVGGLSTNKRDWANSRNSAGIFSSSRASNSRYACSAAPGFPPASRICPRQYSTSANWASVSA
jgi:hypothetical protein